jgi:Raf kinase inhibitor-like YbhB/YbcL family protein
MRMRFVGSLTAAMVLLAGSAAAQGGGGGKKGPGAPPMRLMSSAFADGTVIPDKYTQAGQSVSPELTWTNTPMGTVTFALLFHDPDVAIQKKLEDVTHWIAWNIPGTATKLDEGIKAGATLPDGMIQGKNRGGNNSYMGPGAPANGPDHHYTFELFALDIKLDLGPDASRDDVMKAIDGHILGKAVWEGRFHRPQ